MSTNEGEEVIRHRVSLWGYVRGASGKPVGGTTVTLASVRKAARGTAKPRPPAGLVQPQETVLKTALTRPDGLYLFFDLRPGEYMVSTESYREARVVSRAVVEEKPNRRLGDAVDLSFKGG